MVLICIFLMNNLAQLVRIHLQCGGPWFYSWVGKIHWRSDRLPILVFFDFPGGSAGKESTCSVGDLGLIPGLGRSLGGENCYLLQYYGLENSMDCIPWGRKALDTTESVSLTHSLPQLHTSSHLFLNNRLL